MPSRPALTRDQLGLIGRRRNPDDVRDLLWEIKRLRALLLRAHWLTTQLGDLGGAVGTVLDGLRHELKDEPCVLEFPRIEGG